jgi:hypothetical protein
MEKYPPSQAEVIETFLKWLNAERNGEFLIVERPDQTERVRREIDYLLRGGRTGQEIAVEVSSVWRSKDAGSVDQYWLQWTERVRQATKGKVQGHFAVTTPIRVPDRMDAPQFAAEFVRVIREQGSELDRLSPRRMGINVQVCAMDVFIAKHKPEGSDVTFGRRLPEGATEEFPKRVSEIFRTRGEKLRHHKKMGRETWLVAYNTFWTAMSDFEVRSAILASLGPQNSHIDHVAVVEGDPPDDAWVEVIR